MERLASAYVPLPSPKLLEQCRVSLFRLLFRLAAVDRGLIDAADVWNGLDLDLDRTARKEVVALLRDGTESLACIPPEDLGQYLPQLLDVRIKADASGCRVMVGPQRHRKETGSFFTPPELIARLLDLGWQRLVSGSPWSDLRVGDLSCGVGHFLLAAGRRMVAAGLPRGRLVTQLVGIDVAPEAVAICRMALALEAGLSPDHGSVSVFQADSLLADLPQAAGLDAIIGNPPWVSLTGRQRAYLDPAARARLIARYPAIARWPALHSAMLLRATELVRPGGRIGLVLPRQMADLDVYADVRREVTARAELVGAVLDVGETAFPGVTQPVGLFTLVVRERAARGSPAAWPTRDSGPGPQPTDEPLAAAIMSRLAHLPRFPPETFSDPGVHTGNAAKLLVRKRRPQGQTAPVRIGRDVRPFALAPGHHWLRLDVRPTRRTYFTIRPLHRYRGVPIVLRQTANRPIAARHTRPTYFRNSVLACAGLAGLPSSVMLGILNSALFAWLWRRMTPDARQRAFPQVKIGQLRQLPAPRDLCGRPRLVRQLDAAVCAAEAAAQAAGTVPDALLERIERLVLRAYGLPVRLAPILLSAVRD